MYETEKGEWHILIIIIQVNLPLIQRVKMFFFSKVDRDNDVKGWILISDEVENRVWGDNGYVIVLSHVILNILSNAWRVWDVWLLRLTTISNIKRKYIKLDLYMFMLATQVLLSLSMEDESANFFSSLQTLCWHTHYFQFKTIDKSHCCPLKHHNWCVFIVYTSDSLINISIGTKNVYKILILFFVLN